MDRSELNKVWEQRLEDYEDSGQTASKWCATNDLSVHQFWYWRKKLKSSASKGSNSSNWMTLEMDDFSSSIFIKVGQASIEVKPGYDPKLLANVVRTLGSIC